MKRLSYAALTTVVGTAIGATTLGITWGAMALGDHLFGFPGVVGAAVLLVVVFIFLLAYFSYDEDKEDEV